ncbi:MAG: 1-acyl-sn-glycerol-3-phosphate acyltransferase [Treponema sp.]|jgi:1-acyl-sn-glycerol-3-phosphate acyltransferase|nr:1-acyl-sn-glycerol-3-phosphate acyltransferase [Treponema sp.]
MFTIITLLCLFGMVTLPSIGNILAYPVSVKMSSKISNYIVKKCSPRVFSILRCYKHFVCWNYYESKKVPEQFVLISNHQSLLDIPVIVNFFNEKEVRFIAKDKLGRHIPLVSEMLRTQKHCLIPRKAKPMDSMNLISEFGKRVLVENQIPVIFPEGTRTKNGDVGKFYSAGFRNICESSGLPVVVCALDGGYRLRDLKKIFVNLKRGSYRIKVVKVFDSPKTKDDCLSILEESKVLIQNQLNEWRSLPLSVK